MKKTQVQSEFFEFDSIDELNADDRKLLEEAKKTVRDAYAPYSHFQVGAAVLLENGVIVRGNNQENASYPIGLCAERVAVFAAGANYPGIKIKAIAITASSNEFMIDQPVAPCGACRQAIAAPDPASCREGVPVPSRRLCKLRGIREIFPEQNFSTHSDPAIGMVADGKA